ncbi:MULTISPECIES: hypothetical protein [unclassified Spiroplasma]|uniref:hypothetical protein n=1 Tax=unclassified Spiroplasma TaxID=2637901 RepID=UPI00313E4911
MVFATLATSKLVGAARGGGAKGFWKQFGTGIATPFVATYKKINPQLASKGNQENKRNTIKSTKLRKKSLNKKLGKVERTFTSKNSFSYLKPTTKSEIKHNKKVSLQNLNEKQTKINKKLKDHLEKSDAKQAKWKAKAAKKQEKKSGK